MSSVYEVKAALFDMDGVLADTKEILLKSWKTTFDKYQIPIKHEIMESLILGVLQYDRLKKVLDKHFSFDGNADLLIEEAEELYRTNIPLSIKPVKGLIPFLQELKENSIKIAVTTSAKKVTMNIILDALNIHSYFNYYVCSEDVINRKPDPEVFQIASDALNVKPEKCVVFEDAPDGIEAAKKLNMVCIALKTTFPEDTLIEADLLINSFENFPWHIFRMDKE